LLAALTPDDRFAFRADLLDSWQLLELEGRLQPVLTLLGYRPASELEKVSRLRREAGAYADARAEADALRAELHDHQAREERRTEAAAIVDTMDGMSDSQRLEAMARELADLRRRVRAEDVSGELRTLRWKAKRYDQIRAAASPLMRLKQLRTRF
jgi:hypothetical protein